MSSRRAITCGFAFILLLTAISGCEDMGIYQLTDAERDSMSKIRSGQYTLISNKDLDALKQQAELGKSIGRYQIHTEASRTWRLDTANGNVCLLLASQDDWKKPETQAQACTN